MKSKSTNGQRHNALKHGAFAKDLLILDENPKEFDELHKSCINELKPSGRLEEEVVFAIANYMWRKRRVERLFIDESNWLQEHPNGEHLRQAARVIQFIKKGMPCSEASKLCLFLPKDIRDEVQTEVTPPSTDFDDQWISQLKESIRSWILIGVSAAIDDRNNDSRFIGETAAKIRELTGKQTALEDRLDMMIDKALKRLANLKAFKEVM